MDKSFKKIKEDYINGRGMSCPFCRSEGIEAKSGYELNEETGGCLNIIKCLNCGAEWKDIYQLVDIESIDAGDQSKHK